MHTWEKLDQKDCVQQYIPISFVRLVLNPECFLSGMLGRRTIRKTQRYFVDFQVGVSSLGLEMLVSLLLVSRATILSLVLISMNEREKKLWGRTNEKDLVRFGPAVVSPRTSDRDSLLKDSLMSGQLKERDEPVSQCETWCWTGTNDREEHRVESNLSGRSFQVVW